MNERDATATGLHQFPLVSDIVDWLSGCKHGFIPYLQNNWTLHALTIVTLRKL